jgi:hypothetical protein|tara:strand:+ start:2467 stop:2655 length:189 start_codon:yes stop_codon:yes gene_type:complete
MEITTDFQALKTALTLAIQTDDNDQFHRAMELVYEFAFLVAPEDISLAKEQVKQEMIDRCTT